MDLKIYYLALNANARESLARRCNTSVGHLRNVAYGKTCGETLAIDIERETLGAVTCEELRPDLAAQWAYLRGTKKEAA